MFVLLSFLVCVCFRGNTVHNADRKSRRSPEVEGFCWHKIPWYEYDVMQFKNVLFCFMCSKCVMLPLFAEQNLKDILIGGESGGNISMIPLLLFSEERGTDTRLSHLYCSHLNFFLPFSRSWALHIVFTLFVSSASGSFPALSQTSSFLCELNRFLGDVIPRKHPESPPVQLTSLHSLPPLTLGLSSGEALLARLINSSALTVFSFSGCCSMFQVHHGELAMSVPLLEELRQRLEQTVTQIVEIIREEEVGHRAMERLGRLIELSGFLKKEPATGDVSPPTPALPHTHTHTSLSNNYPN